MTESTTIRWRYLLVLTAGLALAGLSTILVLPPVFLGASLAEAVSPHGWPWAAATALLLLVARKLAGRTLAVAIIVSVLVSVIVSNWFLVGFTIIGFATALAAPAATTDISSRLLYLCVGIAGTAFYLFNGWALAKGWNMLRAAGRQERPPTEQTPSTLSG